VYHYDYPKSSLAFYSENRKLMACAISAAHRCRHGKAIHAPLYLDGGAKPQKKRVARRGRNWQADEAKAPSIAAKYGVSW
jgi:hypothetical protein